MGLQFAVCYEDATFPNVKVIAGINTVQATKEKKVILQSNYFSSSNYIKINDQPLVLCFGPQVMQTPDKWQQTSSLLSNQPRLLSL